MLDSPIVENSALARPAEPSAFELFKDSFAYEAGQQLRGLAQIAGRHDNQEREPEDAASALGWHAQLFGRASADLLPTLAVAIAARYGLSRSLGLGAEESSMLLARPRLGLSVTEGGVTGLLTGIFLKPVDAEENEDTGIFNDKRLANGLSGALSFGIMTATSALLPELAAYSSPGRALLNNHTVNGILSGIPAGFASVQLGSLINEHQLASDSTKVMTAIYENVLLGGTFATLTGSIAKRADHKFEDFSELQRIFKEDPAARTQLSALYKRSTLYKQDTPLAEVKAFVLENPLENQPFLSKVLSSQSFEPALSSYTRLSGLKRLDQALASDPIAFDRMLSLAPSASDSVELAKFIDENPSERRARILKELHVNGSRYVLSPEYQRGIETAQSLFVDEPEVAQRLIGRGAIGEDLFAMTRLQSECPERETDLKELLREGTDDRLLPGGRRLSYEALKARLDWQQSFGHDSIAAARLPELDREGVALHILNRWRERDGFVPLFKELVESGAPTSKLSLERVVALYSLKAMFKTPEVVDNLLRFEGARVKLPALSHFAGARKENADIVLDFARNARRPSDLSLVQMKDAANLKPLKEAFDDGPINRRLSELQRQSLSARRLQRYVLEAPQSRVPLVKELIASGADVARMNAQISLSVFPDDVAVKVADAASGTDIGVPKLLHDLRDWSAGRYLRDLVIDHVRADKPLTADAIDALKQEAKSVIPIEAGQPADFKSYLLQRFRVSERRVEAEKAPQESYQRRDRSDDDTNLDEVAKALNLVADRVQRAIPADKTVVLLGRDAWPLLPLLRERGRDVQYFLWSRNQISDEATRQQWLKEVPPRSAVIDTGFAGSILDAIRKIDNTATGYLMRSNNFFKYRQFLWGEKNAGLVGQIEGLPKLIPSAKTYTDHGGAVVLKSHRKSHYSNLADPGYRWFVEAESRDLLRALKLPEWDVWRYSQFVGMQPAERLLVNTPQEVASHYERVGALRNRRSTIKLPGSS